ncbi:MAG: hypothetical protein ABIG34_05410 [Candidatus Peregrinibacteria bacterium]
MDRSNCWRFEEDAAPKRQLQNWQDASTGLRRATTRSEKEAVLRNFGIHCQLPPLRSVAHPFDSIVVDVFHNEDENLLKFELNAVLDAVPTSEMKNLEAYALFLPALPGACGRRISLKHYKTLRGTYALIVEFTLV